MKKSIHTAFIFIFFLSILFGSCSDPCKNIQCFNRNCEDGKCICDEGYSGEFCSIAVNDKFLGSYLMTGEVCTQTGEQLTPYPIKINGSKSEPYIIYIEGLYEDLVSRTQATISKNGIDFTIPKVDFGISLLQIDGTGSLDATGQIIIIVYSMYKIDSGELVETCTAQIIRK